MPCNIKKDTAKRIGHPEPEQTPQPAPVPQEQPTLVPSK